MLEGFVSAAVDRGALTLAMVVSSPVLNDVLRNSPSSEACVVNLPTWPPGNVPTLRFSEPSGDVGMGVPWERGGGSSAC